MIAGKNEANYSKTLMRKHKKNICERSHESSYSTLGCYGACRSFHPLWHGL